MKRSLFIAIAVLLMAALFVSCNADKALEDQLYEVSVEGNSRALSADAALNVDIENLYWYYSAQKVSGVFKTGATEWKAVKNGKGLAGANLGSFSKGGWAFCFYGYSEAQTARPEVPKATAVYYQEGLAQTVTQDIALSLTLEQGTLPAGATLSFAEEGITWEYEEAGADLALTLKVFAAGNTEAVATVQGVYVAGSTYKYVFNFADSISLESETAFTFRVFADDELVGESVLTVEAAAGYKYFAKGSVDIKDETANVIVFDASVPGIQTTEASGTIAINADEEYTVKTSVASKDAETAATSVTFPAGSLATGEYELSVGLTDSADVDSSTFVVDVDGSAVAVLSFNLGTTSATFTEPVTVETYIAKGLAGVSVAYNGDGAQPTDVTYDAATGKLTFKTTHFSDFIVSSHVAMIGDTSYKTVEAAIAAVPENGSATITLLQDANEGTLAFNGGRSIVLDLGGNTLSGDFIYVLNGSLTVKNGTTNGIYVYGLDTDDSGMTSYLKISSDAVVEDSYAIVLSNLSGVKKAYDATIDIDGTLKGWFWVMGNIINDEGDCVININNGAKTENIALQGYATLNINEGATVTGPATKASSAIEVRSGVLNVNGGEITCLYTPTEEERNNNGTSTAGAGLAVSQYNNNSIKVVIKDAKISGDTGLFWTHTYDTFERTTEVSIPFFSDGTTQNSAEITGKDYDSAIVISSKVCNDCGETTCFDNSLQLGGVFGWDFEN